MKNGWEYKTIGELCDLNTGGTPSRTKPEYFGGDIKWLVSGDIHNKEIFDCEGRITEKGIENSNARVLPINSVIIALNGQGKTRGTVALLRTEATCNQSLVSISPKDMQRIVPEYLYHNLNGRYDEIRKMTGDDGNDRRGLNMPIIRSITIPVPPIEEQRRIVAILDEAFACIDKAKANTEKNIQNARELFDSYLNNIFSNPGPDWEEKRFDEVCILQRGFDLPTQDRKPGRFALVTSNGITDRIDEFKIKGPGVATGRSGTIGNLHYIDEDYWPLNTALYIKNFHGNNERCIYYFLKQFDLSRFASGTGVPTLNRNHVHGELVFFPTSFEKQREMAAQLDDLTLVSQRLESVCRRKIVELDELEKSILQKAFAGELKSKKAITI